MKVIATMGVLCLGVAHAFVTPGAFSVATTPSASAAPRGTATGTGLKMAADVEVTVGEGEPLESALMRFKRDVNRSGHMMDLRWRSHFETNQEKKKRKKKEAQRTARMTRQQSRKNNESQWGDKGAGAPNL